MSSVKRWHMPRGTSVSEGEGGEFVLASDYDALAAECERLRLDNLSKNGSMKAFGEQIAALQRAVKNRDKLKARAETERDAALAELAALKGGREAVAMIRYARGVPGFENEMPHVVSCNDMPDGLYEVYIRPFPQQSAAGIVEALKQYADDANWCYDTCDISRDVAKEALAAYEAKS